MTAPTAESLFLQLWCTATNSDDAPTPMPGTPEFREHRSRTFGYWARCWIDCQRLAAHLADVTKMQETLAETFRAMSAAEVEDEAAADRGPCPSCATHEKPIGQAHSYGCQLFEIDGSPKVAEEPTDG